MTIRTEVAELVTAIEDWARTSQTLAHKLGKTKITMTDEERRAVFAALTTANSTIARSRADMLAEFVV